MFAFLPCFPLSTITSSSSSCSSSIIPRRLAKTFMQTSPTSNPSSPIAPSIPHSISPSPRTVISSLRNVSYDIGDVRVVSDVSLDLMDGEIVCILGPSGSGKSTILRILAGLTAPSEGSVLYKGRPFTGTNPGASIVFQTFALYPWLTVLENVQLGLSTIKNIDQRKTKAMRAIDVIGLDGYENAYPRELSGGMRQRVGFARALAVEPEFLCMDEPFSALDVLTAENLRSELLRLWQAGDVSTTSVLIVTHGIEEAVGLADRIVILGKDPGHVRTVLPIRMKHPRERKSLLFQKITDLVYTILSERDYTVSQQDIQMLTGQKLLQEEGKGYGNISTRSSIDNQQLIQPLEPLSLPVLDMDYAELSQPLSPIRPSTNEADPQHAERYPQLPPVRIGSVGGLLSFIAEESADLYKLGQRLQLDVDDLYPLIDAAYTLGLIELDDGDVRIKPDGLTFTQASIDERKHIVRTAALKAPGARLIAQIHRLLSEAGNQTLPQELIFDTILLKHFSPMESRRQLEIAIEWGRFAELFGYESLTGTLFLDTGEDPDGI